MTTLVKCEYVTANDCTQFHAESSLYCCEWISDYEDYFTYLIYILMWMDFVAVMFSTLVLFIAIIMRCFKFYADESIYLMIVSTIIL